MSELRPTTASSDSLDSSNSSGSSDNPLLNSNDKARFFAAKLSLVVGFLIMLFKFYAFRQTGSETILSDALESIANVAAAAMVVLTLFYASKPLDKNHPYGHGKIEFISAAFEGGLVAFAAVYIVIEGISALIYGHEMQNLGKGVVIVVICGFANAALGWYLVRKGRALKSIALESSGKHVLSDVWTSIGIVAGLIMVFLTGWVWLDAVIAMAFGGYLAFVGWGIVSEASAGLLDREDPEVLQQIAQALKPHMGQGIIDIHEIKVIRSGRYHHIDMHLVLPDHWTIRQTHERLHEFESAVIQDYHFDGEMHFHYDPCRISFCQSCDLTQCPLRQEPYDPAAQTQAPIRQSQAGTITPISPSAE